MPKSLRPCCHTPRTSYQLAAKDLQTAGWSAHWTSPILFLEATAPLAILLLASTCGSFWERVTRRLPPDPAAVPPSAPTDGPPVPPPPAATQRLGDPVPSPPADTSAMSAPPATTQRLGDPVPSPPDSPTRQLPSLEAFGGQTGAPNPPLYTPPFPPDRPTQRLPALVPPLSLAGPVSPSAPPAPPPAVAAATLILRSPFWQLPGRTVLDPVTAPAINDTVLVSQARVIEATLARAHAPVQVQAINAGPVMTQFALELAPGVRITQITARIPDLALALRATTVRVDGPIPGKALLGLLVSRPVPAQVRLADMLAATPFPAPPGTLRMLIGQDQPGNVVIADLIDLPHLLIAGTTGTGKSAAVRALLLTLLLQYTPDEFRLLIIDTRRVEYGGFNGIPHLLRPVVTVLTPTSPIGGGPGADLTVMNILKWGLWEGERRARLLAAGLPHHPQYSMGFRNIAQYQAALRSGAAAEPMPPIILIIDDLTDLMNAPADGIPDALRRLAALGRVVGLHLILVTQSSSIAVVSSLIKANFPARLVFTVGSHSDSRSLLDVGGAEQLRGAGAALYKVQAQPPLAVQTVFVPDAEFDRITRFWRAQTPVTPPPASVPVPLPRPGSEHMTAAPIPISDDNALLAEAIRLVQQHNYASTSMLQRRLRIGYNRAVRLIAELEQQGIIGPAVGSRSREVLIKPE